MFTTKIVQKTKQAAIYQRQPIVLDGNLILKAFFDLLYPFFDPIAG